MPRKSKGPRLYVRKDRDNTYFIRDGSTFRSTGTRDCRKAEIALARYIEEKYIPKGPSTLDKITVSDVLKLYGDEKAPYMKSIHSTERVSYAINAIVPIIGRLPISAINGEVCRRYGRERDRSPATIRRELGVLQAALNYCYQEGHTTGTRKVTLPDRSPQRERWLTRDEVARLLRAVRRSKKGKHLARFILLSVYTGTRKAAILNLQSMPNTQGGWVNTTTGLMHRRGIGVAETKKRQPAIPLPRQLLAHVKRWKNDGSRYLVHVNGAKVLDIKTAWKRVLIDSGIDHCCPHDMRHTAVTWAMQRGADKWAVAGFFGMGLDVLERVYGHHHPDHLKSAVQAMERKS